MTKSPRDTASQRVAAALIANAESAIRKHSDEFVKLVMSNVHDIEVQIGEMANGSDMVAEAASKIQFMMHDLMGQGELFGFPLISRVASIACDSLRDVKEIDENTLALLSQCAGAIRAAASQNRAGNPDDNDRDLIAQLEMLAERAS